MTQVIAPPPSAAKALQTSCEPPFSIRAKMRSIALVAFALFGIANAVLYLTAPVKFDPYKYAYRGWSWWTMADLKQSLQESNLALLGSSLMVSAAASCDANYLNKSLDLTKYHNMAYLDDKLHAIYGGNFHTFNLSAPGQMPSDAYLMLKAMAATGNRPDVVVYGVAPRDFIDSMLSGPNDTEAFRYLTRIVNIDEVANAEFRTIWSKLDWCLQKVIYFYDYSLDIRLCFDELSAKLINKWLPRPYSNQPFTFWDRVKVMPQYLPLEIHEQAVIAAPVDQKDRTFKDNTYEYKARYKSPDMHTYRTQMYFLRKMAEYCRRERIELVLVNMPIMYRNVRLLRPAIHKKYLTGLTEFAWNQNVVFYDLCSYTQYGQDDFHDTVHMNGFGAKKFFDTLIGRLTGDPRSSTALSISGLQMEKHRALLSLRRVRQPL